MDVFSTIGLFAVIFTSLLGTACVVYVLVLGSQQLRKQVKLGGMCQQEADAVMKDVRVPTTRMRGI